MAYYIDEFPGRTIVLEQEEFLYFGGTSYLGLQGDADFQDLHIANIKKYGTHYGASRNSNIRFSIYEQTENYLCNLVGSEACTTLSSGYLTGQMVVQYFDKPTFEFFYAPNTHASLSKSNVCSYSTFASLAIALREHLAQKPHIVPLVLLDTVDFSGTHYPDFEGLKSLPLDKVILIADDSHGIGILGTQGGSMYRYLLSLAPMELIVCCSLGKSLGIQAGAIFGTKSRIDQFTNTPFFGGASPAAPAAMATLIKTTAIFHKKRTALQKNIALFKQKLGQNIHFTSMPYHPAFSFKNPALSEYLEKNKVLVTNFHYPDASAEMKSRIVINAQHTPKDIERLSLLLKTFFSP
ncbi:pyridoxal phosphate-dependent aminotransferase family protein [Arenibacter sp. 6A1]|uniref:pyridoxal phosphate-dependent aminotransferase family protein n=1 Tax=Arenibacter sp. 6A1 TaxID=2720391 RepID=UPI001444EF20|nr:pyridoxal phosphate-dependent aminotransferase family protein [Arenibacter sp. 6A1]NKI27171.1 pyridoxal phosphate-dependent aminotransferase family protein [Arenibacter sp. 6A1]